MSTHNKSHEARTCKDCWRKLKILILWKGFLSYKILLLQFYYILKPTWQQPKLCIVSHTHTHTHTHTYIIYIYIQTDRQTQTYI